MNFNPKQSNFMTIGIIGQPNVGKSSVFNLLTGLQQEIGNWPGKTVDRHEGILNISGQRYRMVDVPGAYSLTPRSDEEQIVLDFIKNDKPNLILVIGHAQHIDRSLFFLSEAMLFNCPLVFVPNMIDMLPGTGVTLDIDQLAKQLTIPVVGFSAKTKQGIAELKAIIQNPPPAVSCVDNILFKNSFGQSIANLLINAGAGGEVDCYQAARVITAPKLNNTPAQQSLDDQSNLLAMISSRYETIKKISAAVSHKRNKAELSYTDKVDQYVTHEGWGLLIVVLVFALLFSCTYLAAIPVQGVLDEYIITWLRDNIDKHLFAEQPVIRGLLSEGIVLGAGTVLAFVPVLAVFYFLINMLEDSGYLARVAVIMDRYLQLLGLPGKSALPLFLGLGCNVPAVIGSRVVESKKSRLATILLTPFVPCSARFTVLVFLAPVFFGYYAPLMTLLVIAVNALVFIVMARLLTKSLSKAKASLILELPNYHWPQFRLVLLTTYQQVCLFIKSVATWILGFSILLWFLSTYPGSGLNDSYLASVGRLLEPIAAPLGFDWRLLVALFSGIIARENVVTALGIIYGDETPTGLSEILRNNISSDVGFIFLLLSMLFVPCLSTVFVVRKETRAWGYAFLSIILNSVVAITVGVIARLLISYL
ncbi:MAG: ferrous iron transport protein B [Deltaproteobacteria bacterium]|nr:ferrous iron transport protein B [Deltaproteobacteria bacterium]